MDTLLDMHLKSMNKYKKNSLTHGEAISIGMILATKISQFNKRNISQSTGEIKLLIHFKKTGLPIQICTLIIKIRVLLKLLLNDKKNHTWIK